MRFTALAKRNLQEMYRDPITMGFEIGFPAVMLVILWGIGQAAPEASQFAIDMLTPGIVIFGIAFLAIFSGVMLARDREGELFSRLLTTPLRSSDFILAYSLPYVIIAILQIAVFFAVGYALDLNMSWNMALTLVPFLLMAFCFIGIGMILGSLLTEKNVSGIGTPLVVITPILGGVYFELSGGFRTVADFFPFAHAVDGARAVIEGASLVDIATDLYWILAYMIVFFILGVFCLRWKTKG
jgi:ABC-2 type transport system permease protein